jgi:hypothetical protein
LPGKINSKNFQYSKSEWYYYCSENGYIAIQAMKQIFYILLISQFFSTRLYAAANDSLIYTNRSFNDKIRSVQLFKEEWILSYPVIKLNSTDKLLLQFDLLGDQPETYYYSFIHCDKDWKRSAVYPTDYMEGFPENQIEEFDPSFNTTINYIHYKLTIPNERISFKLSGNYIIIIYPFGEPEKPVLTRRFMITEERVTTLANAHRPQMTDAYDTGQQVDIQMNYTGLKINDPYRDIYAFILQNGSWNIAKRNMKPDFVGNNELNYNSLSKTNIFPGGNEFRYFDLKSIRYQGQFIRKIDFVGNSYHVFLYPSENREFKPYFFEKDFNGKYYIAIQEGRDMEVEADYVYVYFTLPSKYEVPGGKLYVSGALNDWNFNKNNLMTYNQELGKYECTMLLKQGWYNFEYIFLKNGESAGEPSAFEGNHYETENDYLILFYYRNPMDRYDRLIGSTLTNTANPARK